MTPFLFLARLTLVITVIMCLQVGEALILAIKLSVYVYMFVSCPAKSSQTA